jgi:hypothetical protein
MQVIAGFFGSGALAVLPVHRAAFFHCFKKLAQSEVTQAWKAAKRKA